MMSRREDAAYCAAEIRDNDTERYLSALLAPIEVRAHLMALYAFNLEIASVRENINEPAAGEFRLQWWFDALGEIYGGKGVDHPIARALADAIDHGGLPRASFEKMLEARRFDIYNDPVPDLPFLEGYASDTASTVIELAVRLLSAPSGGQAVDAARFGGLAYALTGLMRAFPIHCARRQLYLPGDKLKEYGIDASQIFERKAEDSLSVMLAQMRNLARRHLKDARKWAPAIPDGAIAAFLPLALIEPYLDQMDRPGYNPYRDVPDMSALRRQWRLWRASRRGAF